jgi:site-specific recombinase XerD
LPPDASTSTIRHRLTALSQLYELLDGADAFNPTRGIKRPQEPEPEARNVAPVIVQKVFSHWAEELVASNKGTKTIVRCKVLYWTGMRPSQLMRVVTSTDVEPYLDQDPPLMIIRKAGKGGKTHTKPLNKSGVAAWREFIAIGAQGNFSTSSVWKSWTRACARAGVEPFNPYRLRHSYASGLRRAGADLADIQDILGHASPKTTQRYAAPSDEKLVELVRKLDESRRRSG